MMKRSISLFLISCTPPMHFDFKPLFIFFVCAYILLCAGGSLADEYKPIKMGGLLLEPKLHIEQRYSDNIYASDENAEGDFATAVKPSLIIKKLYRDHEFSLRGESEAVRYYNHSKENMFNYKGEFSGRLTARRVLTLPFKLSYAVNHKDRLHERSAQAREPTRFDSMRSEIGAEYDPGRLMLGLYGGYNRFRYEDGENEAGGDVIREDGDYDSLYLKAKALYRTRTDFMPFVSLQLSDNDYLRHRFDGTGFDGVERDNRVIRGLGGIEFKYHDILSGSAAAGWDRRSYEDNSIDEIASFSAEGKIQWAPFRKVKLNLEFLRQSEEDNEVNDGIVETLTSAGIDYELRHNLFLNGGIEWENTKFANIDRHDDIYGGSVGLNYILNRKIEIGGEYLRRWRDSTQNSEDFDENIFMLRLTGKL